jgi:hypothetical protein
MNVALILHVHLLQVATDLKHGMVDTIPHRFNGSVVCTSPSRVFSILIFTTRAVSSSFSFSKGTVIIGVLIVREVLIISFIRGTPKVIS